MESLTLKTMKSHLQERAGCHGQLDGRPGRRGREQQGGPAQALKLLGQSSSTGECSDRLDPFFIERGLPAEREIGEREPLMLLK
jgi:hypothetical protein